MPVRLVTRILLLFLVLVSLLLLPCESSAGRVRAVRSRLDAMQRILVITAHPDDEVLLAPLLAGRCVRGGASCAIVVTTWGELGGSPEVRAAEMERAAALLGLRLTQWSYADGGPWPEAELVQRLQTIIALEQPDMILTFDPEHGSTGHPDHRRIGALVLETAASPVFLLQTTARFVGDGFVLGNGALSSWVYAGEWEYAVRTAEIHASQFTAAQVESLRTLPVERQRVWFKPAP